MVFLECGAVLKIFGARACAAESKDDVILIFLSDLPATSSRSKARSFGATFFSDIFCFFLHVASFFAFAAAWVFWPIVHACGWASLQF